MSGLRTKSWQASHEYITISFTDQIELATALRYPSVRNKRSHPRQATSTRSFDAKNLLCSHALPICIYPSGGIPLCANLPAMSPLVPWLFHTIDKPSASSVTSDCTAHTSVHTAYKLHPLALDVSIPAVQRMCWYFIMCVATSHLSHGPAKPWMKMTATNPKANIGLRNLQVLVCGLKTLKHHLASQPASSLDFHGPSREVLRFLSALPSRDLWTAGAACLHSNPASSTMSGDNQEHQHSANPLPSSRDVRDPTDYVTPPAASHQERSWMLHQSVTLPTRAAQVLSRTIGWVHACNLPGTNKYPHSMSETLSSLHRSVTTDASGKQQSRLHGVARANCKSTRDVLCEQQRHIATSMPTSSPGAYRCQASTVTAAGMFAWFVRGALWRESLDFKQRQYHTQTWSIEASGRSAAPPTTTNISRTDALEAAGDFCQAVVECQHTVFTWAVQLGASDCFRVFPVHTVADLHWSLRLRLLRLFLRPGTAFVREWQEAFGTRYDTCWGNPGCDGPSPPLSSSSAVGETKQESTSRRPTDSESTGMARAHRLPRVVPCVVPWTVLLMPPGSRCVPALTLETTQQAAGTANPAEHDDVSDESQETRAVARAGYPLAAAREATLLDQLPQVQVACIRLLGGVVWQRSTLPVDKASGACGVALSPVPSEIREDVVDLLAVSSHDQALLQLMCLSDVLRLFADAKRDQELIPVEVEQTESCRAVDVSCPGPWRDVGSSVHRWVLPVCPVTPGYSCHLTRTRTQTFRCTGVASLLGEHQGHTAVRNLAPSSYEWDVALPHSVVSSVGTAVKQCWVSTMQQVHHQRTRVVMAGCLTYMCPRGYLALSASQQLCRSLSDPMQSIACTSENDSEGLDSVSSCTQDPVSVASSGATTVATAEAVAPSPATASAAVTAHTTSTSISTASITSTSTTNSSATAVATTTKADQGGISSAYVGWSWFQQNRQQVCKQHSSTSATKSSAASGHASRTPTIVSDEDSRRRDVVNMCSTAPGTLPWQHTDWLFRYILYWLLESRMYYLVWFKTQQGVLSFALASATQVRRYQKLQALLSRMRTREEARSAEPYVVERWRHSRFPVLSGVYSHIPEGSTSVYGYDSSGVETTSHWNMRKAKARRHFLEQQALPLELSAAQRRAVLASVDLEYPQLVLPSAEQRAALACIANHPCTILAAPGGTGKSTLLSHVAHTPRGVVLPGQHDSTIQALPAAVDMAVHQAEEGDASLAPTVEAQPGPSDCTDSAGSGCTTAGRTGPAARAGPTGPTGPAGSAGPADRSLDGFQFEGRAPDVLLLVPTNQLAGVLQRRLGIATWTLDYLRVVWKKKLSSRVNQLQSVWCVIVDEMSMVGHMNRLLCILEACPNLERLVLVGDPCQLPPVQQPDLFPALVRCAPCLEPSSGPASSASRSHATIGSLAHTQPAFVRTTLSTNMRLGTFPAIARLHALVRQVVLQQEQSRALVSMASAQREGACSPLGVTEVVTTGDESADGTRRRFMSMLYEVVKMGTLWNVPLEAATSTMASAPEQSSNGASESKTADGPGLSIWCSSDQWQVAKEPQRQPNQRAASFVEQIGNRLVRTLNRSRELSARLQVHCIAFRHVTCTQLNRQICMLLGWPSCLDAFGRLTELRRGMKVRLLQAVNGLCRCAVGVVTQVVASEPCGAASTGKLPTTASQFPPTASGQTTPNTRKSKASAVCTGQPGGSRTLRAGTASFYRGAGRQFSPRAQLWVCIRTRSSASGCTDTWINITGARLSKLFAVAFATTVHSMQGDECDTVVYAVERCSSRLLYTALTRARSRLVLVVNRDWLPPWFVHHVQENVRSWEQEGIENTRTMQGSLEWETRIGRTCVASVLRCLLVGAGKAAVSSGVEAEARSTCFEVLHKLAL